MNISSTVFKPNRPQVSVSPKVMTAKNEEQASGDSFTLSSSPADGVMGFVASAAVLGGGAGSAVYAGVKVAGLVSSGLSGLSGAFTGLAMGALSGGAAGYGLSVVSSKLDPSDAAGDAMMSGLLTLGGAAVGGIAGAISGFVGAEPLLVAPAVVGAGFTGMMVPTMVLSKFMD